MRKPVYGVCDQVRLKPACTATETSQGLEILDLTSTCVIVSKQRTTKVLIRLPHAQADLRLYCSHMAKTSFLMTWLILCRFNCLYSFPVWCLGQGVEFDFIGYCTFPFHLLYK